MPQEKTRLHDPKRAGEVPWGGKFMNLNRLALAVSLAAVAAAPAFAVEEIFSRTAQIFQPHGETPQRLIKLSPPAGAGWRDVSAGDFRLKVPAAAQIDDRPDGSRVLQVVLTDAPERPRPVL